MRQEDLRVLRELAQEDDFPEAFSSMLVNLESGRWDHLTARQRAWVNDVAERHGIEPSSGEVDDAPEVIRLTRGPIPRGREVDLLVKDRPLKPPVRRT